MLDDLLAKVKANLILAHDEDDELLKNLIRAAVDYAVEFQKRDYGDDPAFPPATEQAIIMLSCHFYESRDGSTGGFFADSVAAAGQVWLTANRLLLMNKNWVV
jgi:hypothetical protein